jgi:superfamily II DNA or RNA helicase
LIVDRWLTIGVDELRPHEWKRVFRALTFTNRNGREVTCYRWLRGRWQVRLPRGAWSLLPDHVMYDDQRNDPKGYLYEFMVELDSGNFEGQRDTVTAMFEQEQGIIVRPPGSGKTQIMLAFIAACQTPSLVLVHTEDILEQWVEYAKNAIPDIDVGVVRGQKFEIGDMTIATVQTAVDLVHDEGFWLNFGALLVDETHHAPARTWERILNACSARYRFGVTATDTRPDGMEPLMRYLIGPVIQRQKFKSMVPLMVSPIKTEFRFQYRGPYDWNRLIKALVNDEDRNSLIAEVAVRQLQKGHSTLVLSRRIEHLENIRDHMALQLDFDEGWLQQIELLMAPRGKRVRREVLSRWKGGDVKVVLATQLANEALDVPRLSRLVLAYPEKHFSVTTQKVGRLTREHEDKSDAIIFDIVDEKCAPLRRQWGERKQTYRKLKIAVKKTKRRDRHDTKGRNEEATRSRTRRKRRGWHVHRVLSRRG